MMDAIRRAVTRYAERLDQQAQRHEAHAFILAAVAHRLRQILADHPKPYWHLELGVMVDGKIVPKEEIGGPEDAKETATGGATGTVGPIYKRWVTAWKEIK